MRWTLVVALAVPCIRPASAAPCRIKAAIGFGCNVLLGTGSSSSRTEEELLLVLLPARGSILFFFRLQGSARAALGYGRRTQDTADFGLTKHIMRGNSGAQYVSLRRTRSLLAKKPLPGARWLTRVCCCLCSLQFSCTRKQRCSAPERLCAASRVVSSMPAVRPRSSAVRETGAQSSRKQQPWSRESELYRQRLQQEQRRHRLDGRDTRRRHRPREVSGTGGFWP